MTRLLPLIPFMLWLFWSDQRGGPATAAPRSADWLALLVMLGGILGIVAAMAGWARALLHAHRHSHAPVPTRGFHRAMLVARALMVAWFGVALYALGFGAFVDALLAPLAALDVHLPGLVAATWPIMLGWLGLWWAAYPVERATREQNLLVEIDSGLTPRAPPTLGQTLASNFRMQVLFMLAPVLAVAAVRDAIVVACVALGVTLGDRTEATLFVASSLLVFVASPELLIRVLRARTLAPSPLRHRLEAMARQLGLSYRDILVWHTSYGIGNAAVMGLVPRFRYILLTDLLIETLDERQIQAVFAHEAGHVKHRHLLWYAIFWATFLLAIAGPGDATFRWLHVTTDGAATAAQAGIWLVTFGLYLALFGVLSRLFERQADVYAARSIESLDVPLGVRVPNGPMATPVGPSGAESFVSALARVAEINHRPAVRPRRPSRRLAAVAVHAVDVLMNFTHPSIPDRIDHLRAMAGDAAATPRFDRKVAGVMLGMTLVLATLSTWAIVEQTR